jgi:hypothetical protein
MSSPLLYLEWQPGEQPGFLQGPYGAKWGESVGALKDHVIEGLYQSVIARFIEQCMMGDREDALVYHGRERRLDRYPGDTTLGYGNRLKAAWELWAMAGTKDGITAALALLGYSDVTVVENYQDPDGSITVPLYGMPPGPGYALGEEWWRFWVIINKPNDFVDPEWRWDVNMIWGPDPGEFTWGPTGTSGNAPYIRPLIELWKPSYTILSGLFVILPDDSMVPI